MEDILPPPDAFEKNRKKLFSILSFSFAMLTVLLFGCAVAAAIMQAPVMSRLIIWILVINLLLGFLCAVISLVRKEKLKYFTAIGAVINIFLFLLVLGAGLFAVFTDIQKMK